MGKFATYRKRGGTAPRVGVLPPPPAPVLAVVGPNVVQTTSGLGSPGGQVQLEFAPTVDGPWGLYGNLAYSSPFVWAATDDVQGSAFRCFEIGQGVHYSGVSPASAVLDFT